MSNVARYFTGGNNKGDDKNDDNLSYDEEKGDATSKSKGKNEDEPSYAGDNAGVEQDNNDVDERVSLTGSQGGCESKTLKSDSQNYVALLRSKYKKLPTNEDNSNPNLDSIAEIEPSASKYRPTKLSKPTAAPKVPASNYTDVASLRNKYKNISVQSKGKKQKPKSTISKTAQEIHSNIIFQGGETSSLYPTAEELYGEGAGLGSNIDPCSGPSRSATSFRRNGRSSLQAPSYRTDASAVSNRSKAESSGGSIISQLEMNSLGDAMAAAAAFVRAGMKTQKHFKKGERVLIAMPALTEEDLNPEVEGEEVGKQLRKPTITPVNKLGYAAKEGKTETERQGPFIYVLATVQNIHFKEDARHYTVERADTGAWVRADNGWMEPIEAGSDAEKRALTAALRNNENINYKSYTPILNSTWFKSLSSTITRSYHAIQKVTKDQASKIISGSFPYRLQCTLSSVNFIVICSLIVAFGDLCKYTFFVKEFDHGFEALVFVAWIVLVLELFFQVLIRPDNYSELVKGSQAYHPSTARYMNRFHFFFESVALAFVIPEFLPLFGIVTSINLPKALIFTAVGNQRETHAAYILGYLYVFTKRLRLFCLVRHKRNHFINAIYLGVKDAQRTHLDLTLELSSAENDTEDYPRKGSSNEDDLLPKAAKINTALLLVNSQRAMIIILLIALAVPFFATAASGGPNHSIYDMSNYLHNVNRWTVSDKSDNCEFLESAVSGWISAEHYDTHSFHVSFDDKDPFVVWAQLQPPRCGYPNGVVTTKPPECNKNKFLCEKWEEKPNEHLFSIFGLRKDYLVLEVLEDEGIKTTVVYNTKEIISTSCFNSLLLQLLLLILVLFSVGCLRHDTNQLVIKPLQRLLKILLRYAINPLSETNAPKKGNKKTVTKKDSTPNSGDKFGLLDFDDFNGDDKLGSYETERLIAAVTKITDLLRKCWGVAGAGIISSNLARNIEGEKVVFNPTVPGKLVYALFGFAGINDYGHLLRSLDKDVMGLINDVALVLHNEVYRWGLGESGQCNKNLGGAFLMVYRIGDFEFVQKKNDEAKEVIFSHQGEPEARKRKSLSQSRLNLDAQLNSIHLASLPGINNFGDRALLGLLKAFAGINRENSLKVWEKDYRVGGGVGAFSLGMSFGMDAGWAVEGAVGSNHKIDATYLSSHVNMASRMMSACKQYKLSILLSQDVEELLSKECRQKLRQIDTVYVKGSKAAQRIYTYDARHKGIDFFLNKRTDEIADKEANMYSPKIWGKDQDLLDMRSHVTDEFLVLYEHGLTQYLHGNWKEAVIKFKEANESMIRDILDSGRLEVVASMKKKMLDASTKDEDAIHMRETFGDGPCQTLISYIENRNCECPASWNGVRELTSK